VVLGYTVLALHAGGLANTANSLLAIKTLVYDERRLTLAQLVDILRANWGGPRGPAAMVLSRCPAYGNDDDAADAMVARIFDDYTELAAQVRERNGVLRPAGVSTFGREIEWRKHRKADRRRPSRGRVPRHEPLPLRREATAAARQRPLRSYCKNGLHAAGRTSARWN